MPLSRSPLDRIHATFSPALGSGDSRDYHKPDRRLFPLELSELTQLSNNFLVMEDELNKRSCSRCNGDGKAGWGFFGKCARCNPSRVEPTPGRFHPEVGSEPFGHCKKCKGKKYACALCVLDSNTGKCTRCHSRKIRFGSCARCGGAHIHAISRRYDPAACKNDNCAGEKNPCQSCCQRKGLCTKCHGSGRTPVTSHIRCDRCGGDGLKIHLI